MNADLSTGAEKPLLKVWFTDFWLGFDPQKNFFMTVLSKFYRVELDREHPDVLFYSYRGKDFYRYRCPRIYFTGENIRPKLFECDFALSFDYSSSLRNFRLPLYVIRPGVESLVMPKDVDRIMQEKTRFCSFVISNRFSPRRINFFKKLSRYKPVDSGGRYLNNVGGPVDDKFAFLRSCKFNIAFENTSYPGYTTEKIADPMVVGSIPIYWGNPLVDRDFNTRSFINWHDYGSDEAVIERIIQIDRDPDEYRKILSEPWLPENRFTEFCDPDRVEEHIRSLVVEAQAVNPVGNDAGKRLLSYIYSFYIRPAGALAVKARKRMLGF
ncbi:MAG TPA: glycosyltransferase family 10 [Bacteroidales bacterium]|nr:glycosyltransferase family 10 [Bacteroidales bacterium]